MGYRIKWRDNGIYRKYLDPLTSQDGIDSVQEAESDARFETLQYVINDLTEVTEFEISKSDVAVIAAIDRASPEANARLVVANVVKSDEAFGLSETYCHRMQNDLAACKTFHDIDEATAWVTEIIE